MAGWDLPTSVEVCGRTYEVRTDFRVILDVLQAMVAPELDEQERLIVCLSCFYRDFDYPLDVPFVTQEEMREAWSRLVWFVNEGKEERQDGRKRPRLMDWEQDFPLLVGPVNKVAGFEVRAVDYLHWWTFLSYYREIDGDCTFANVVGIRSKQARGKPLDKSEKRFKNENPDLVELRRTRTDAEREQLEMWTSRPRG